VDQDSSRYCSVGISDATIGSILLLANFEVGAVLPSFVLGNGLLLLQFMSVEVPRLFQQKLLSNL
jgi:hypothetical protein